MRTFRIFAVNGMSAGTCVRQPIPGRWFPIGRCRTISTVYPRYSRIAATRFPGEWVPWIGI
jgi:hypothetical protein